MADNPANLREWSTTTSSNSPTDATTIGAGLADVLQEIQGVVRRDLASVGANIASSANPDVAAVQGLYHTVTGNASIVGLGSTAATGIWKILETSGTPIFKHNTALAMPGSADFQAAAGDVLSFFCEASNQWRCVNIQRANGEEVKLGANALDAVTAAATIDLDAPTGWAVDVSGNSTVSAATLSAGRTRIVRFTGAPPLIHGASFVLPGSATVQAAAGDFAIFRGYAGGVVRCVNYQVLSQAPKRNTIGTSQATTSGTSFSFSSLPSNVFRVTLNFHQVSLDGTDDLLVQIGPSGGVETTGYVSTSASTSAAATGISTSTAGFIIRIAGATGAFSGQMVITLEDSTTDWIYSHSGRLITTSCSYGGGHKAITGTLSVVTVTRTGTDNFDGGSLNIDYETW